MAGLRAAFLSLGLALAAAPAAAEPLERWQDHVSEASARFGVPQPWIWQVMRAESAGRTHLGGVPIESRAGAMGLMQLMPGTWREMRAAHGLGSDPHAPRDNILAGTAYLRAMYDRFGYPGLFAAYNAGPQRYAEHLATGRRLPRETILYVAKVAAPGAGAGIRAQRPAQAASAPTLFIVRPDPAAGSGATAKAEGPVGRSALFVPLSGAPR